jgi:hypothetical protein
MNRPLGDGLKRTGAMKWFDPKRGYGWVASEGGGTLAEKRIGA